jgi:hypothetical protein
MRSAQIVGCRVIDRDGVDIGLVRDIRIAAGAAPEPDSGHPAYGITALVVGSVGVAQRLGYGRGQMGGPWPLTSLFRALARRSLVVDWADVASHSVDRIEIRRRRSELQSVLEADVDENGSADEADAT